MPASDPGDNVGVNLLGPYENISSPSRLKAGEGTDADFSGISYQAIEVVIKPLIEVGYLQSLLLEKGTGEED